MKFETLRTGKLYNNPNDIRYIYRIVSIATEFNKEDTSIALTGDKPTIFYYYSGNTTAFELHIHKKGWKADYDIDSPKYYFKTAYIDAHFARTSLEELYNDLVNVVKLWVGDYNE